MTRASSSSFKAHRGARAPARLALLPSCSGVLVRWSGQFEAADDRYHVPMGKPGRHLGLAVVRALGAPDAAARDTPRPLLKSRLMPDGTLLLPVGPRR